MTMRFLGNTHNPADVEGAKRSLIVSFDETPDQAWAHHLEWLADKIIGRPQASADYTVERLEAEGIVGVYVKETKLGMPMGCA